MTGRILPKRILMIFAAILALYTIAGFFLVPWMGKKILIKQLGNALGRPVAITSVSMNPYSLVLGIKGFSIKEKKGDAFISVNSLLVNLSAASLFRFAPVITQLELESPDVNLIEEKDETFNFSDLVHRFAKDPSEAVLAEPEIFGFKIFNVKIINGKISFSDQIKGKDHIIEKLNLNLPLLSSLEKDRQTKAIAKVDFLLNQAEIKITLESLPFSPGRDSAVTLKTGTIDLLNYLRYLPLPETLQVNQMETFLDLTMTYSQARDKDKDMILEGALGLANIDIRDVDHTPVLSASQINLTIAPSDLFDKKLTLANLKILSPKIHLGRDAQGKLNLLKYLPGEKTSGEKTGPGEDTPDLGKEAAPGTGQDVTGEAGFVFQLDSGEIDDASLFFTDGANKTPFKTTLSPVSIQVKDLVASPGKAAGEFSLSLKTEAGESLVSTGQFSTIPLDIQGSVTLEKFIVKKYTPYFEKFINFDIQGGQVHLDAGFSISKDQAKLAAVINNRELRITNFKLWDRVKKEVPVSIPKLLVRGSVLDTGKQHLEMGIVKTSQGKILLKRQKDGSINLVKNLLPGADKGLVAKGNTASPPPAIPVEKKKEPAWEISLNDFSMEKFGIGFSDVTPKEPVSINLSDISIQANNLKTSGREKAEIKVGMKWNKTGKIQVKGDLVPSALTAGLDVSLEKIAINSLQPYFADQVNILVTKGLVQTQGRLALSMGKKAKPLISFKGKTSITDFESFGKISGKEFFNCNALYLTDMDVSLFPVKVMVKDISLTDFYSRVIISEKGNINLRQVLVSDGKEKTSSQSEQAAAAEKEKTSPLPEIIISNVTLQGGHIHYADYFTQPNVITEMKEIGGQIKGLSSTDDTPAELQLRGLHGQSSPLDIVGRISPLTQKKFLDLDISFKDIELVQFSPYAVKYIGYEIEKGKLVLDLKYKQDGNMLESQNRLFLDQFTLGEKVDSENATSLPVPLAISLLKNSDGQIDLDLPITGNLDDPEFDFSVAFFEVFENLIMTVVKAPFKFLGALFGGGEELGFVNFEYGSDTIPDEGIQKIDKLVEILEKKEELNLEIEGSYDRTQDGEALRKKGYEALIKSEKIKEMTVKGTPAPSLEEVTLLPEEREAAVLAAYEQADFPKPREEDGKEKEISTEEKEKLLLTHVDINENHLKNLAMIRAENIKNYILSTEKVRPARIFLHNPNEAEAGPEEERFGRVLFLIK